VLLVVLTLAFGALVVRLVDVQALSAARFAGMGRSQRFETVALPAQRGSIVDRHGAELAMSVWRPTVWADPRAVTDPNGTARALAPLLDVRFEDLLERLTTDAAFVYLARKVEPAAAAAVDALDLPGIAFLDEPERVDPAGSLALPVLGQVGIDGKGLSGLERQYDTDLAGRAGEMVVERDPAGRDIAGGERQRRAPERGRHLELTLDRDLQYHVERVLAEQITASRAKAGIVVVMDPRTGEILAMANLVAPARGGPPVAAGYNKALIDVYEPGSVSKLVTLAAAIEEGAVGPAERLSVPDRITVYDATFADPEPHPARSWTPRDVMAVSSNVGAIMMGQRLGDEGLDAALRRFGFAETSGLGFPGESAGLVPALEDWSGTTLATLSIGQGLAVNALQMLLAYNTVANGGEYVAPSLVRGMVDAGGRSRPADPPRRQRVVSPATAAHVAAALHEVVRTGTGTAAAVPGYEVAGKTGTARKVVEGEAGYKEGAYMATFAGFLPAASPQVSAIVVLDEPTPYYGSVAAAPMFAEVAAYAARHLRIPPGGAAAAVAGAATLPASPTRT
jgi:cell division protein FtsI (penicillin-binding protein 3)